MNYSVIIPCGGKGSRMGLSENKIFCLINGETIIETTLRLFLDDDLCKQIVIVFNKNDELHLKKLLNHPKIIFVEGGEERYNSVSNGLKVVSEEYVLIHDAVRPYLSAQTLKNILSDLPHAKALICAVRVKDTMKVVKNNYVVKTLARETLWNAQTPQAFEKKILEACYEAYFADPNKPLVTDDASLIELYGNIPVKIVEGDYHNIKITTKEDLYK